MTYFAIEKKGSEPIGPYNTASEARGYLNDRIHKTSPSGSLLIKTALLSQTLIKEVSDDGSEKEYLAFPGAC